MCGISCIVRDQGSPADGAINRMVARLSHRGPDAQASHELPHCHLGHARLSIIDLGTGAQPMADPSRRYWITFNGEIYNYRQLREELLSQGARFETQSDTEVILVAYAKWGAACVNRFRGMFGFAIWDTLERRLFAARDLFGEKPLYYATAPDGTLLLASEISALVGSGLASPELDREAVDAYLAFGYVPPDRTIYENVMTLPPGHYLEWEAGLLQITRYWSPRFETRDISLDDAAGKLRELLGQAVERQMVADVPVGAFLSGGLDSSTIVALMQQFSTQPVKTFSVGFGGLINELPYARAVADLYQTEHHEINLELPPVGELLERMAEVYDEPFADSSHIPTYLISEFARKHVKVVLSGDGGDELFGGYGWYPQLALSEEVSTSRLQWLVLRTVSKLLRHRSRGLQIYSGAVGLAARWPDVWTRSVMSQVQFRSGERRKLWDSEFSREDSALAGRYYRPDQGTAGLNESFCFDMQSYLPGDILVKVDRAAMAHGLETRAPFLDRDLVEFALSLPASLKVKGDETKRILKHACERYWPPALRSRTKQGFGAPYHVWLGFPDVQALAARVFAAGSPLRRLLPGIRAEQQQTRTYQTWILLTLGLWLERHEVSV